jgi:hypothetical protein
MLADRRSAEEAEKAMPVVERAIPLLERMQAQEARDWTEGLRSAIKVLKGSRGDSFKIHSTLVTVDDGIASARSDFATAISNLKRLFAQLAKDPNNRELQAAITQLEGSRDGLSRDLNELGSARVEIAEIAEIAKIDEIDEFPLDGIPITKVGRTRNSDLGALGGPSAEEWPKPYRRVDDDLGPGSGI